VQEFLDKHDRVKRDMVVVCSPDRLIDVTGKPRAQRGQMLTNTSWRLSVDVLRANFDGLTSAAVPIAPESRDGDGRAIFQSGARVTGILASLCQNGERRRIDYWKKLFMATSPGASSNYGSVCSWAMVLRLLAAALTHPHPT
jgi:hypothetical protein